MFRDDKQAARAIRALLRRVRLGRLWSDGGPTDEALRIYEGRSGCSSGEIVMVQVAFALWGSHNSKLSFARMIDVLDGDNLKAVVELVLAREDGSDAVDGWIDSHQGG